MKIQIIGVFLLCACAGPVREGRELTPAEREKAALYEQKKHGCMKAAKDNDDYLNCMGVKPGQPYTDQTGLRE